MFSQKIFLAALICAGMVAATAASAAPIVAGTYQLHNHPDGNAIPPPYGMKLDELDDATPGHDVFTFNFDDPSSDMKLTYNDVAQTIHIFGVSYGGRDIGGDYAADSYLGIYTIDFVYNMNVGLVPGDDDLWVAGPPDQLNSGMITSPGGTPINILSDVLQDNFTFRFGDEDDDLGYRGHPGISGWGWLNVNGVHTADQDWLFTAELVPEPATLGLLLLGLGAVRARRRRA